MIPWGPGLKNRLVSLRPKIIGYPSARHDFMEYSSTGIKQHSLILKFIASAVNGERHDTLHARCNDGWAESYDTYCKRYHQAFG